MVNEELIDKIKETKSAIDFYNLKPEILMALGGKDVFGKRRRELEALSMKELREIGDKLGVKDTKKSELISEIIKKEVK